MPNLDTEQGASQVPLILRLAWEDLGPNSGEGRPVRVLQSWVKSQLCQAESCTPNYCLLALETVAMLGNRVCAGVTT